MNLSFPRSAHVESVRVFLLLLCLLFTCLFWIPATLPAFGQGESGVAVVSSVTLIDAATDQPIAEFDPLYSGAVVDLSTVGTNLNVRANISSGAIGSVLFGLDNNDRYRTENAAPYAIGGDSGGNYNIWTPSQGEHTLTITASSGENGGGSASTPLIVKFTVVDGSPAVTPPTPTPEPTAVVGAPQPTGTMPPATSGAFVEQDGIIVMEAENGQPQGDDQGSNGQGNNDWANNDRANSGWDIETSVSGFGGVGYIRWNGPNYFNEQNYGVLHYPIKVTKAGRYYMRLRSFHDPESEGQTTDQQNDAWTSGDLSSGVLYKTFRSGSTAGQYWNFATRWEPSHGDFRVPEYNLDPGEYTFTLAARSQHYMIDRIYLYHEDVGEEAALNPELPESARAASAEPSDPFTPPGDNGPVDNRPVDELPGNGGADGGPATANGTVSGELKKWHPVTVSFAGPTVSESDGFPHAFLDHRLQVVFTGPRGQRYDVPGFFAADGNGDSDGSGSGNVWQARFAPDQAGEWRYHAYFRTGENVAVDLAADAGEPTSFNNASGTFTVAGLDSNAPGFLKWGRLDYVQEHYLKFADGPYWIKGGIDSPENFFGFADFDNTIDQGCKGIVHEYATHVADWRDGDPTWNGANGGDGKGIIGALNYLGSQDVNSIYFLPLNLGGDGCETYPFVRADGNASANTRYDISKLEQWNTVMHHAQEQGIALHFVLNETESGNERWLDGGMLGVERKLFYRELIARFGYLLALKWNLSEENDFSDSELRDFANYISQLDWANHQLTVHTHPNRLEQYDSILGNVDFDTTSVQYNPDNAGEYVETMRERSAAAGRPWVIDMDENNPANEGLTNNNASALRKRTLYDVYFSGGNIEWYFGYHNLPLGGDMKTEDFRTREEMYGYMAHARTFMQENLPFWEMEPADDLLTGEDNSYGGGEIFAKDGEFYAVYLGNASNADAVLDLSGVAGEFERRWFNPRNGEFAGVAETVNGGTDLQIGAPPSDSDDDWVLLLSQANLEVPTPITTPIPTPIPPPNGGTTPVPGPLDPQLYLPLINSSATASR